MQDYEKLGAFFLGKEVGTDGEMKDDLVLYDSKDLTTHAVIIGMTGSGKTGLGIGLLEEAAIDNIPVIAIDPKGDLGNILLTFPTQKADAFRPWVNTQEALNKGFSADEYAEKQAALWKKGLKSWGQDAKRIKKLKKSADFTIYTPGSNAGLGVSVLSSFTAPSEKVRNDSDAFREKVQATATSILALLGMDADPLTSREHILLSNIFNHYWAQNKSLDIGGLIGAIQQPPFEKIGVMDLENIYSSKDRFSLAMKVNALLAAPGFQTWMEGEALDAGRLFYTPDGKPRVSVMSIAHLSDSERMFFVCMLLSELISWMRSQPGTSSLRAILYMDEIFGYMPPTANPPSKTLFLTLLKQARAYGLGLVLATQNPVDLDYKGLSNCGTWFLGRLQTERDKARVLDGLEGAGGGGLDRKTLENTLTNLGKRRFMLHNVHEDGPVVFNTRWVMSYLSGPMTRDQIGTLMDKRKKKAPAEMPQLPAARIVQKVEAKVKKESIHQEEQPPILSPKIHQYFLPVDRRGSDNDTLIYHPHVIGAADVGYSNRTYDVEEQKRMVFVTEADDSPISVDWDEAEALEIDLDNLSDEAESGAAYAESAKVLSKEKSYTSWERTFKRWIKAEKILTVYKSPTFKLVSNPGESEGDFRVRLQEAAREMRDEKVAALRKKYASKFTTLENRLMRAEQTIEVQQEQSKNKKMDTVISFGTAILGSLMGRKRISATSARSMGSAIKKVGSSRKEAEDVERAQEKYDAVKAQLEELELQSKEDIEKLEASYNAQEEELKEIIIKPKASELHVHMVGLAWLPYYQDRKGKLTQAWL
ncbi:MAG: DUF87 domain-containing protein [Gammaproteobacteria bacterium]|nr:DUF87 domain-containing protein [Gammaproteobacteria bacterium]NNC96721.1 DUF87 domain-containing protein [Gammaproteobacteria bacterium]NNM14304.1 DUF87 domain-containing protein [Gammaproteobacteria bacterium]